MLDLLLFKDSLVWKSCKIYIFLIHLFVGSLVVEEKNTNCELDDM